MVTYLSHCQIQIECFFQTNLSSKLVSCICILKILAVKLFVTGLLSQALHLITNPLKCDRENIFLKKLNSKNTELIKDELQR